MRKRFITGTILLLLLVPIFTIEILFPAFYGVIFLLAGIASYELITVDKDKPVAIAAIILTVLLTLLILMVTNIGMSHGLILPKYLGKYDFINFDFYPLFALVPFVLLLFFVFTPNFSVDVLGKSMVAVIYVGVSFASMLTLRMMGVRFIIYAFIITILTDMFAFFIGIRFGKHKMAKNISPKKSWEGAIAGTLVATIIASLFALYYGIFKGNILNPENHLTLLSSFSSLGDQPRYIQAVVIVPVTMIASIVGQVGDLIASKFKRSYDLKDFGVIFPGHGGVMDRFDSVLFVSLFLVIAFMLIVIGFPA